jgi:hypothetical protein
MIDENVTVTQALVTSP